eukprot:31544-Pelagococcus_subviridis.AAC.7
MQVSRSESLQNVLPKFDSPPARHHGDRPRAGFFVRRIPAVPVALLAPLVTLPHAAAQLARLVRASLPARDARAQLLELFRRGRVVGVSLDDELEPIFRQSEVSLHAATAVEEAQREIVLVIVCGDVVRNASQVRVHGVVAQRQTRLLQRVFKVKLPLPKISLFLRTFVPPFGGFLPPLPRLQ